MQSKTFEIFNIFIIQKFDNTTIVSNSRFEKRQLHDFSTFCLQSDPLDWWESLEKGLTVVYTNDDFSKSCVSLVKFWEVGGEAPEKILKITMIIEAKFAGIGISGKPSVKLPNQDW